MAHLLDGHKCLAFADEDLAEALPDTTPKADDRRAIRPLRILHWQLARANATSPDPPSAASRADGAAMRSGGSEGAATVVRGVARHGRRSDSRGWSGARAAASLVRRSAHPDSRARRSPADGSILLRRIDMRSRRIAHRARALADAASCGSQPSHDKESAHRYYDITKNCKYNNNSI